MTAITPKGQSQKLFMKTKPIKRNKNIVSLSKDHHLGLLFCWKVRQGLKKDVATERIIKYVKYFWTNHLAIHFFEEETIVFPLLNDHLVQKALHEHQQIKHQIDGLATSPGDQAINGLRILAELIDNHIRFEERELFPHFEKILSKEQLDTVGKQLEEHGSPLTDDHDDLFWNN